MSSWWWLSSVVPLGARVFTACFVAVIGAATGSFGAVVIERHPSGQSLNGRSRCVCGRQLKAYENIPILSWLALRGTARCCGSPIPAWYLYAELAAAAVGFALGFALGPAGIPITIALVVATAFAAASRR
jgi:leader peptidase (prepilin peptidase)/N-methyltransferase